MFGTAISIEHRRSTTMKTDWATDTKGTGQYAEVNGIKLYYETHGAGRPLILLHGGLGSGEMFGPVLPVLAERHQVVTVDLQGHGRTADIDRPIDVRLMAGDIAALIDHLALAKPDVVGYSLGGGVALQTAAQYPAKVRRLVAVSANIRPDAIYPEMRAQQGQVNAAAVEFMKDTPMYQLYQRVAPHPEDFPRLLNKMGDAMSKDFDFTEGVRGLQGAHPQLRRGGGRGAAEPLRRSVQTAWWRPQGRRLDGRRAAAGRPRARHPAGPNPLQHLQLTTIHRGHSGLSRIGFSCLWCSPRQTTAG